MPQHLFINDQTALENNPPIGRYHLLVVGTFNANIPGNNASWFYGRPENEFWCLFPKMLGASSLHPVDRDEPIAALTQHWKDFCNERKIIIVDLFKEVYVDLPGHGDKYLKPLEPHQYNPFNFRQAFANSIFDGVVFTWKGIEAGTLTIFKNQYQQFFEQIPILHLLTPSMAYSESRHFKLQQWRQQYQLIQPE